MTSCSRICPLFDGGQHYHRRKPDRAWEIPSCWLLLDCLTLRWGYQHELKLKITSAELVRSWVIAPCCHANQLGPPSQNFISHIFCNFFGKRHHPSYSPIKKHHLQKKLRKNWFTKFGESGPRSSPNAVLIWPFVILITSLKYQMVHGSTMINFKNAFIMTSCGEDIPAEVVPSYIRIECWTRVIQVFCLRDTISMFLRFKGRWAYMYCNSRLCNLLIIGTIPCKLFSLPDMTSLCATPWRLIEHKASVCRLCHSEVFICECFDEMFWKDFPQPTIISELILTSCKMTAVCTWCQILMIRLLFDPNETEYFLEVNHLFSCSLDAFAEKMFNM